MMIAQQPYEGNVANIPNHTGGLDNLYENWLFKSFNPLQTTAAKKLLKMSMEKITH